ncbi:HlyD family secretion protein [Oceanicola sp. S124]|uniref:HlyD family secretion protein n=1 Tax=Oceanicola sp. S124 TaxID=1042378 RepID=UPI000255863D|nr:HlyD family secretion protein [Oceanicola sp. S124]
MSLLKNAKHALVILALGCAGLAFVLYAWQLPPFDSHTARTENAYVRGRVTAIAPQLSGHVTEVPVQDFQTVAAGDVLVRLDDRKLVQAVAQAEAALDGARASLKSNAQSIRSAEATVSAKEAALTSAEAQRATAQSSWDRYAQLKEHAVVSVSAYDQADLSLRQAQAAVDQARSAVAVAKEGVKSAELQTSALQAQVASAEAALALARIDLENTVIRAPEDGTLGQISVRVGQYVTAGSTLMSEVAPETWVIANLRETEVGGLLPGQPVSFTVDALGHEEFRGHLERLSPATGSEFSVLAASNATGNFTKVAQRVPVRISIDAGQPDAARLVPGLSVVVRIARTPAG